MDTSRHIIKTGFYSEYAREFFNCLKRQTANSYQAINRSIDVIFSDVECNKLDLLYPQTYEFQYDPNGEVVLKDLVTLTGFHSNWNFSHCSNAEHLRNIACQIKMLASKYAPNKKTWQRENFNDSVSFFDKKFPVAEVYFIYDVLLNHARSVNVFKRQHPDIAAKLIGVPRDPIMTEFIQSFNEKRREVASKYHKEIADLKIDVIAYTCTGSKASCELNNKLQTLIDEAKKENALKIHEIELKRDAELEEIDSYIRSFQ